MDQREKSGSCTNDLISELFRVTAESIYDTDMQHGDGREYWPFHPVLLDSLVAPFVFNEFLRIVRTLKNEGYTLTDISNLVYSPTKIANYQYLWPVKTLNRLAPKEKYELAKHFVSMLIILRNGEPFCERGRNLVWSREKVHRELREHETDFMDVKEDPETAKTLAKLEGLLVSYAETLYYYMIDLSRMMHGPYTSSSEDTVFVKEYLHLKAGELWNTVSGFPFDHFQEIGVYNNINVRVFFMGHTHSNPPFPKAIRQFAVIVDGKPVRELKELQELYKRTLRVTEKAVKCLAEKSMDEDFLLMRGVDMFFYPLKPLYSELGENWKSVLPEVHEFAREMKDKVKVPGPWRDWSKEKAVKFLLRQMDFRLRTF